MTCPSCGHENPEGQKFCGQCGTALQAPCPTCGAQNPPGQKFCGECGMALTAQPAAAPAPAAAAERRLVSVLFADLVGFTAASESRDAEDTRELLSRYFDAARTIIGRYGGSVEKFIGDAVMAVWGAPTAQEDDAERAVRAALDLVAAVPELDPALKARTGVLTGEAAVNLGAEGQGMVAGDLVNTASRIQSEAEPGTVLVGEATRRASEAAIVYEDAGERELKGKLEPVPLWRALRVVASRGGEGRSVGLEAPFVGRDRELRTVKELFHATGEDRKARLLSVVGVAGVGKSRLAWEFEKYLDGLADTFWWHRGRCLSYGDGVAYWALAEMVRGRIGAREDEEPATTAEKLRVVVAQHFADPEEAEWIEQRLGHLLGLTEVVAPERENLFPAWRRFFERLAEQAPAALLFEDLHWADAALVSFIEDLLDWSRNYPIFVLTLARPEIVERHPGFPGATRSATTLPLDPLYDDAMDELLRGLVPGLPDDVARDIRERADGIQLYAVETVRMLLDRGLLEQAGSEYRLVGSVESLDVPETLHALIAARLDGLPETERALLQNAAVLGKTFTPRGVAALAGLATEEVEGDLTQLVRKEVLYLETDPRSPGRGQYGFLQALVQRVAYDTLSRRERRSRHLEAARFLAEDSGMDPSEIAEVIASHYLDAYETQPDAPDSAAIKADACSWFIRAAERALSLAAAAEAQRGFERAATLADDDVGRAKLLHRAGDAAWMADDATAAIRLSNEAVDTFGSSGLALDEARALTSLAQILFFTGHLEEAVERLRRSLEILESGDDEAALATVSAQLGRLVFFQGDRESALAHTEQALELGERLRLPEVVSQALNTKAILLEKRPYESLALMRGALALAREHDLGSVTVRAYLNLGFLLWITGAPNYEVEEVTREGLAYVRRRGSRGDELNLVAQLLGGLYEEGRWDQIEEEVAQLPEEADRVGDAVAFQLPLYKALIAYHRGEPERTRALLHGWAELEASSNVQLESCRIAARTVIAAAEGRHEEVVQAALEQIRSSNNVAAIEGNLEFGGESATVLGSAEALEELLAAAEAADVSTPPSFLAKRARMRARIQTLRREEPAFDSAIAMLRENGERFWLAVTLLEQAEWLAGQGRDEESHTAMDEARETFERLRAKPWLDRADALARRLAEPAVAARS
jgi:class 3 adenylate cyclase/tetratricopeptide (TPR) repeat protein